MLIWVLLAGALLCLIYFIVIVAYAGIGTSYVFLWLLFAGVFAVTAGLVFRCQRYPEHTELRPAVSFLTLCSAGVIIMLILQILIFYRIPETAEPDLEYLIVLGSRVKEDGPGRTLKRRLDKAVEYVAENPDTMLILSGGQERGEPETEAAVMKEYLLSQGVPASQMILEDQSVNTMENIMFSRELIDQARSPEAVEEENVREGFVRPPRIGVLTSNYHLFRAMKIAQKQGIFDVSGIAASSDPVLLVHMSVRDALAILKERLLGHL